MKHDERRVTVLLKLLEMRDCEERLSAVLLEAGNVECGMGAKRGKEGEKSRYEKNKYGIRYDIARGKAQRIKLVILFSRKN